MKVVAGGQEIDLGTVEAAPTISITDFSRRETDDFGVTTVVERGFARRLSVRLALPFDHVDSVQQQLAALRATPAQWIADDRFAWLNVEGFYKDFELDLAVPPISYCTLTVEGLAETEPGADAGGDPAPSGSRSTLRLLQPVDIASSMLVSSNVAENDHPEWSGAATYAAGARVIRIATHRIYESLVDDNVGHNPVGSPDKWLEVGATNRWAMFDQALGSATKRFTSIAVTLAPGAVRTVALLDVVGSTVRVQAPGYDQTKPVSGGSALFLDMPGTAGNVTVTVAGIGQVAVGTLLLGHLVDLGVTEASPTAGIIDFSRKETDDFGEATIVQRAWAKRMASRALFRTDAIDQVANRIAKVRARPSLWIGDEGSSSLTIYGFFKDFSIEVGPNVSTLSLSIEGLSEAAKLAPIGGITDWPDVGDPNGTKPDDNATVGAPNGTPVGDRPAEQVIDLLDALDASYALVVAAVGDATEDAADARDEAAEARDEADKVRTDLAAEILRAQGAEGALFTQVVQAQTTADGSAAAIIDAVTILADADAQLAARQETIESANEALDARVTTQEATLTTAIDSVASRTLTLEASVNATGLIGNPEFGGLPAGPLPVAAGWIYAEPPTAAERFPLGNGRYGWMIESAAGIQAGIISQSGRPMSRGWHIVTAEWKLIDGVAAGAAVIVSPRNAANTEVEPLVLPMLALKDSAGLTVNQGETPYRTMRTATLVNFTGAVDTITSVEIAAYNNFAPVGQGAPYKKIVWQRLDVRPATPMDIEAGTSLPAVIAGLSDEATTRATETSALANRATTLETSVNTGPNRLTALRSAITDEATTRTTADTTLSNRATSLESAVLTGPNSNTALRAAITDEQTTRSTADSALANRATNLEASVNTGPNNLPTLRAAVNDEITARVNAVGAVASRTTVLEASAGGGITLNPEFVGLTEGPVPSAPGWAFTGVTPAGMNRYPLPGGKYGWWFNASAGQECGLISSPVQPMTRGWKVLEASWWLLDGALAGACAVISARNAQGAEIESRVLPLTTLRDNAGNTALQGSTPYRTMVTSTLVQLLDANIAGGVAAGFANFALAGQGTPYKQIVWRRLNLRDATPEEIEAGVALPALKATVEQQAGVLLEHDGKLGAYWEVEAVAGGRARIRARADATGSAIDMAADVIVLGNQKTLQVSNGRAKIVGDLDMEGGNLIIRGTSHMKVLGLGFGVGSEFVEWYGPILPSVAQCSRVNGVSWETKAGAKKLGGFSIGQLVAGTTNPALAASVTASTGAFGSNGGSIQANASWYYRRVQNPTWPATTQGRNDFIAAMQAYGATSIGAGDWSYYGALPLGGATSLQMRRNGSNVATQTVSTGTRTVAGREPEVGGAQGFATISDEATLSFTYTDPQQSTANRTYEAVLTRHAGMAVPTEQTVSIGTIE